MTNRDPALNRLLLAVQAVRDEALAATDDELEELSDALIELLMDHLPIPGWVPFLKGYIRKKLDELLPYKLFELLGAAVVQIRHQRAASGRIVQ